MQPFMDIRGLTPQPGRMKCVWVPGPEGRLESIWVPDWEQDVADQDVANRGVSGHGPKWTEPVRKAS